MVTHGTLYPIGCFTSFCPVQRLFPKNRASSNSCAFAMFCPFVVTKKGSSPPVVATPPVAPWSRGRPLLPWSPGPSAPWPTGTGPWHLARRAGHRARSAAAQGGPRKFLGSKVEQNHETSGKKNEKKIPQFFLCFFSLDENQTEKITSCRFTKQLAMPCSHRSLPSERSSSISWAKRSAAKWCCAAAETPRLMASELD